MNAKTHLICGRSNDTELSAHGIEQSRQVGMRLGSSGVVFDKVYSSIAKRAVDTARHAGLLMNFTLDHVVQSADLQELDQGDWTGKNRVAIYSPELVEQINKDNWNFTPPNGESQRMVEERMLNWVDTELVSPGVNGTVGVFTHGFAIKCLLRGIMNFDASHTYKIQIGNASLTQLKYSKIGWQLVSVNDAGHLP
jgi:broad specificity phosphatase PhoE